MATCTAIETWAEVRELPPAPGGWRLFEAVGAHGSCSCGSTMSGSSAEVAAWALPHGRRVRGGGGDA